MCTDRHGRRSIRRLGGACLALLFAWMPLVATADTVASLLGNFTVNQYCEVRLDRDKVGLRYVVVFGQLPALRELRLADADRDGVTTQHERDAYVAARAPDFAHDLVLTVDGERVPLSAVRWTTSLPAEQGGFSMRLDIDYEGMLPKAIVDAGADAGAGASLQLRNDNYAGQIGWHEIVVRPTASIGVFDTDAFDDSLTNGLVEALTALPATGPLDERAVRLRFAPVASVPPGARPIAGRGHAAPPASAATAPAADALDPTQWLQMQTRRLVERVSAPQVSLSVLLVALLASLVLGALHAFSPGHGKTIVGAYLIGSRSTPRHAVILGVTVTITHTLVVFVVGLLTLFASHYILPERLIPALSLISGLLVLGMGIVLLRQRWPAAHMALGRQMVRWFEGKRAGPAFQPLPPSKAGTARFGMRPPAASRHAHSHGGHAHGHEHAHAHSHAHSHDHADGGLAHSHGGRMHSHLPPGSSGERVTMKSLVALGISGGLVPCPSAMVLLLAAIALNKTYYGILMVIAFSVGLALTLVAVGLVFLYARRRFSGRLRKSNLVDLMPAVSGVFITVVGLFLCYGALTSTGLGALRG